MLKLKRIELQGFKSFYDRTEMKFHGSGIAAIVGPNGCGKSNLSDAISWVLGEQSAKTLRGTRMEDVIFAGTRDRKPLGMASVTLTLIPGEETGTLRRGWRSPAMLERDKRAQRPKSRCHESGGAQRRNYDHAAVVPVGRERISAEWQAGAFA